MTVSDNRADDYLVYRIACGDQDAFQELFDKLAGDVFKLSYSILLDYQQAEDSTQDVFVKLWKKAADWQPDASIKTWMLKVTRNHCLDILRKKKNDLKKHDALYKNFLASEEDIEVVPLEGLLDQKKHQKIVKNAVFTLSERQREAITLVYYMEVQNIEAAQIMDMGTSAFDSLLARARRNLRDRFNKEQDVLKGCFTHGKD